jgi:transcriptional regulator with XRE-family HTH domain
MLAVKAHYLLKQNVDALLKARGQTRKELAQFCRRSEAWISKIFSDKERNIPLKYLDRMADFFGLATYQLFQPGISPLTERRSGHERRTGRDRRISRAADVLTLAPSLAELEAELKKLSPEEYNRWVRRAFGALSVDLLRADRGPRDPAGSTGPQSARVKHIRGK